MIDLDVSTRNLDGSRRRVEVEVVVSSIDVDVDVDVDVEDRRAGRCRGVEVEVEVEKELARSIVGTIGDSSIHATDPDMPMHTRLAVASILALTCSAAVAQEKPAVTPMPVIIVQEPTPPAPVFTTKLSLPSADGSQTREYVLSDFSLSITRAMSYGVGDPRGEVSGTMNVAGGLDEVLLQWASQATIDTQQARKLTVRSDNPAAPKVYELDGARVLGLNLTGGSYNGISMQIGLTGLTIDGVKMN